MDVRSQMLPAAEAAARIVRGVPESKLDAPTPCPDWEVRALINHMIFWSGRGETAVHRLPVTGPGEDHDFTAEPDWAERYAEQARKTAQAWQDPAAFEGNASLTGGEGMPAPFIAGILFGECITHGWDLAVATGQKPEFPQDVLETEWERLVATVEMGREYGVYGPEVPVPEDAPLLDRIVGLTGRDPHWTP
ncbi:MAG TPA: TIGR03086 family metal-binding protein [Spirillospora sp.]